MDEDDDLYGGMAEAETTPAVKAENEVDMDGEEEEEESDDDVQFTLEKPEGAKPSTPAAQPKKETPSDAKPAKTSTPIVSEQPQQRSSSTVPPSQQQSQPPTAKAPLIYNGKEGKDFPALHTSTVDVNATPLWPDANGKPITAVDIDADLAEHSKPWRQPGTDLTDFFNYGFDEFTWAQYAIRQQTMAGTIAEQRKQDEAMKMMFGGGPGGGPGGGMGGGGGGPGGGMPPGMPSEQEMMQMMAQGMSEEQIMQHMMQRQMMGGGGGGGPPQGPQGGGNFGAQGQGGFGGQGGQSFGGGRVPSGSPHPQGQGFQPPTGPSGQGGQGGQDGFMGNMEGYSPQQMAIMQQQQGGGRGRGRGRGRGYY